MASADAMKLLSGAGAATVVNPSDLSNVGAHSTTPPLHALGGSSRMSSKRRLPGAKPKGTKYTCHVCGSKFDRKFSLNRHQKCHTLAKPYPCPVPECGKFFAEKNTVKRHVQSKHPSFQESTASPPRSPNANKRVKLDAEGGGASSE